MPSASELGCKLPVSSTHPARPQMHPGFPGGPIPGSHSLATQGSAGGPLSTPVACSRDQNGSTYCSVCRLSWVGAFQTAV